jgi:hypothetical protein
MLAWLILVATKGYADNKTFIVELNIVNDQLSMGRQNVVENLASPSADLLVH